MGGSSDNNWDPRNSSIGKATTDGFGLMTKNINNGLGALAQNTRQGTYAFGQNAKAADENIVDELDKAQGLNTRAGRENDRQAPIDQAQRDEKDRKDRAVLAEQQRQAAEAKRIQDEQQAAGQGNFNQQNSLENALRDVYLTKKKNPASAGY